MIVAIFYHEQKKFSFEIAKKIVSYLQKKDITVVAEEEKSKLLNIKSMNEIDLKDINFLISLGGDGTILRLVHKYKNLNAAILGINLGNLGFMADIPQNDIFPSLDDLISKKFDIENRILIEGKTPKNKSFFAANEVLFHRNNNQSLIDLSIYIDNIFVNTFSADGMIIATPNGSTAYSLSAGGPILSPEIDSLVITPICPHTITNRPLIISANKKIEIKCISNVKYPIKVLSDGLTQFDMNFNDSFTITKSLKKFRLVKLKRHDYFTTLRTKLNWSGKITLN